MVLSCEREHESPCQAANVRASLIKEAQVLKQLLLLPEGHVVGIFWAEAYIV